ncbi:hypothetical protein J132_00042, partial [Termitomyces sp. J132]
LATTPRSKGKGKGKAKAQDEEDEDIEDHVEETFTDKRLATLLRWRRTTTVVDTGLGAGVKLDKAKGKVTVSLERRQEYKRTQGACDNCWADNDPEGCWYPTGVQPCYRCDSTRKSCSHSGQSSRSTGSKFAKKIAIKAASVRNARAFVERQRERAMRGEAIEVEHSSLNLPTSQEEAGVSGSGGAKVKSRAVVESDEDRSDDDGDDDVPLARKRPASPSSVASAKRPRTVANEGEDEDVGMREATPLATVAEVEREASDMEVEGEEEEVVPVAAEEEEQAEEVEVVRRGTWSDTPLRQVGDDELEWLGEDLGWPTPLTTAASLLDFDERAAGVERRFQRELEAAREELLAARARYTVAKRTLATLAGYRRDCQAFLAWQEENNVGEGDWEEAEAREVPEDDADLGA